MRARNRRETPCSYAAYELWAESWGTGMQTIPPFSAQFPGWTLTVACEPMWR
jgi:hypothetical protein